MIDADFMSRISLTRKYIHLSKRLTFQQTILKERLEAHFNKKVAKKALALRDDPDKMNEYIIMWYWICTEVAGNSL